MKLLAIESATEAFSVALNIDGDIQQEFSISPRNHSKKLLGMIEAILSRYKITLTQLDAIAFSAGPGAFTGVRIATSIAQGLAFAAGIPVIPISTLAALAQYSYSKYDEKAVLVAIDARINQLYWGAYQFSTKQSIMINLTEDKISNPENINIPDSEKTWIGVGSGWSYQPPIIKLLSKVIIDAYPDATSVAKLAEYSWNKQYIISPDSAIPIYLRDKVALKKHEQPKKM